MAKNLKLVLVTSLISATLVLAVLYARGVLFPLPDDTAGMVDAARPLKATAASVPLTEDEQINVRVYREASPGVVNITNRSLGVNWFFEPVQTEGVGSGAVIDGQGHIVTNYHVIARAEELEVTLLNQKSFRAHLVGGDPLNDLAVIKIDAPAQMLKPIKFGDSSNLKVGQKVLAIGNPFRFQGTLTTGVISAVNRTVRSPNGFLMENLIQTDAAINEGNSGGPLLNTAGELIGINTMIFSPAAAGNIGLGFAIPSETVLRVVNDLIQYGQVRRPYLGIRGIDITPSTAAAYGLPPGVLVQSVEEGSPADQAGVRPLRQRRFATVLGDIIVEFDGRKVESMADLLKYLDDSKPGDVVELTLYRDGRRVKLRVRLEERPDQRRKVKL